MTDNYKIMTWNDVAIWLATLTPEQLAMTAIVFENEAGVFTEVFMTFLATEGDVGDEIYGQPNSKVVEGQPFLKIW